MLAIIANALLKSDAQQKLPLKNQSPEYMRKWRLNMKR